jgi:hypothetical protein
LAIFGDVIIGLTPLLPPSSIVIIWKPPLPLGDDVICERPLKRLNSLTPLHIQCRLHCKLDNVSICFTQSQQNQQNQLNNVNSIIRSLIKWSVLRTCIVLH